MEERVQTILAKNSSRMGTPRCDCLLFFLGILPLPTAFSPRVRFFTSDKVASPLLLHSCSGLSPSEEVVAVSWIQGVETSSLDSLKDCEMRAISPSYHSLLVYRCPPECRILQSLTFQVAGHRVRLIRRHLNRCQEPGKEWRLELLTGVGPSSREQLWGYP